LTCCTVSGILALEVKKMKPYKGVPELKQLAHLRENYKGKNENGGRKCVMGTSRLYKLLGLYGIALPWDWDVQPRYVPPRSPHCDTCKKVYDPEAYDGPQDANAAFLLDHQLTAVT
jgi:hypothetical protein